MALHTFTTLTFLDRFLHNAEVIAITGKSYRLRNGAGDVAAGTQEAPAKQKGRRSTAGSEGLSPRKTPVA